MGKASEAEGLDPLTMCEPASGTHLTVSRVGLQAVLEHLTSETTVASSTGAVLDRARDGVTGGSDPKMQQGRAEERLLARAAVFRCIDDLAATPNLWRMGEVCTVLRDFADRAKLPEGAVVVGVLRAYLPWGGQWPERGLVATYEWMRTHKPSLAALDAKGEASVAQAFRLGKAKAQRGAAALLVSDAHIILSAWVEAWNRKQGRRGAAALRAA